MAVFTCTESQLMKGGIGWTILRKGIRATGLTKRVRTKANMEMSHKDRCILHDVEHKAEIIADGTQVVLQLI